MSWVLIWLLLSGLFTPYAASVVVGVSWMVFVIVELCND